MALSTLKCNHLTRLGLKGLMEKTSPQDINHLIAFKKQQPILRQYQAPQLLSTKIVSRCQILQVATSTL